MNKMKDGLAPIYVRVTVDARRIKISLVLSMLLRGTEREGLRGNREVSWHGFFSW
jgi:hypothetical protein